MTNGLASGLTEEKIGSAGGVGIFLRSWKPMGKARAVVVICHGVNSHGGQYLWPAGQFAMSGLAPFVLDLRGRGKSDGEPYYVDDISEYVADVSSVIRLAQSRYPGLPVFLLGHSAGGVVSCSYALDQQAEIAGLICESFAFKVPAPDAALGVIKLLSAVAPRLKVLRLKNEDFSRDPAIVHQMNSDPLIADEKQPTQTVAQMVRADQRLEREFPNFKLPLLILHGKSDKATKPSGSQQFYDTAGSSDKTLKLYEGAYHDLLNDTDPAIVMSDVTTWIDSHLR